MGNKIILIEETDDQLRSCNVCCNHNKDVKKYELTFGKEFKTGGSQSVSVCLCNECLNEFADTLWNYLEQK